MSSVGREGKEGENGEIVKQGIDGEKRR